MKYLSLTKGKKALLDDDIYEKISNKKWHVFSSSGNFYAVRDEGYKNGVRDKTHLSKYVLNTTDLVDHINGDTLDNRRCNLRVATKSQNAANSKIPITNTSGYKGVTWNKKANKWQSQLKINQTMKYLGIFEDKISAAKAYNAAALKYFGEFSRLNKI